MNGVHIACTGRLGGDPEQKYLASGTAMLSFSVAVDEHTKATEERAAPDTTWLRCTVWEARAEELAAVLKKGSQVYVEGKLRHGQWVGQDGQPRCGLNVSAWTVQPLGHIGKQAPKREPVAAGQEAALW